MATNDGCSIQKDLYHLLFAERKKIVCHFLWQEAPTHSYVDRYEKKNFCGKLSSNFSSAAKLEKATFWRKNVVTQYIVPVLSRRHLGYEPIIQARAFFLFKISLEVVNIPSHWDYVNVIFSEAVLWK